MYKAVGFDLGGVMVDSAPPHVYAQISARLGVSPVAVIQAMATHIPALDRGEITHRQFWGGVSRDLGVKLDFDLDQQLWTQHYVEWSPLRSEMVSLVRQLKASGYRVGMLSNIDSAHARQNLDRHIFEHFEEVVLSYQIGARKPEPAAYMALVEKLDVRPRELAFIDDLAVNIAGAARLGITGILYRSPQQVAAELKKLGFELK